MPVKIRSTKDVTINGIKATIYGFAGAGKTRMCATAPKPIILSAETGLLSLADYDIPYIQIDTVEDIGEAYKFLEKNDDFQTICLDSLSEITEVIIAKFLKDPDIKDGRQAYGKLAEAMMPMIRKFRDLKGKNVVFTAKAYRFEDELTGKVLVEPMMPGKVIPNHLPYMLDELLYLDVDVKGKRFITSQPTSGIQAKDRSGKLDKKEPPDLTHLFNKMLAKKEKKAA